MTRGRGEVPPSDTDWDTSIVPQIKSKPHRIQFSDDEDSIPPPARDPSHSLSQSDESDVIDSCFTNYAVPAGLPLETRSGSDPALSIVAEPPGKAPKLIFTVDSDSDLEPLGADGASDSRFLATFADLLKKYGKGKPINWEEAAAETGAVPASVGTEARRKIIRENRGSILLERLRRDTVKQPA
jgi:hypothetical protein